MELLRSTDPYQMWMSQPAPPGASVQIRIFWHHVPLQTAAVRDLVRAAAAGLLPMLDLWNLTPTRPWLTMARRLAGTGLLPIPASYEPATQLAEYRRLLPNHHFRVEAGLSDKPEALPDGIAALTRILLWASETLGHDIALFVPSGEADVQPEPPFTDDEPEIIASPLRGKPHPLSPSEQKLARWIAMDETLDKLFSFNSLVRLGPLAQPCVDLLWEAGKLVVEIDDPSHWRKEKYAADRQRDFELLSSGFMVLRITADEVLSDTARAMNKIRTCVALRSNHE